MHEYSIVQAMFDQIEARARECRALSVRRVLVRIGRSAGVDVPLLKTAYDNFRVRTICEGAPLDVEEIPERWTCESWSVRSAAARDGWLQETKSCWRGSNWRCRDVRFLWLR